MTKHLPFTEFLIKLDPVDEFKIINGIQIDLKRLSRYYSLNKQQCNMVINLNSDKIKNAVYKENNINHDLPSMCTMGLMHLADKK